MEPFHTFVELLTGSMPLKQLPDRLQDMNPFLAFLFCVMACTGIFALVFVAVSLSMAGFVKGSVSDWARDGAMIGAALGVFAFVALNFLEA